MDMLKLYNFSMMMIFIIAQAFLIFIYSQMILTYFVNIKLFLNLKNP